MRKRKSTLEAFFLTSLWKMMISSWGMIIDVCTNRSFSEFPGEPLFGIIIQRSIVKKPTSEESYEFTACKEFLQESSDYEWRVKVE